MASFLVHRVVSHYQCVQCTNSCCRVHHAHPGALYSVPTSASHHTVRFSTVTCSLLQCSCLEQPSTPYHHWTQLLTYMLLQKLHCITVQCRKMQRCKNWTGRCVVELPIRAICVILFPKHMGDCHRHTHQHHNLIGVTNQNHNIKFFPICVIC